MSFGKKCLNFLTFGTIGYLSYKAYRYITGIINISNELPVYLKNVIGESPSMNINVVFNRLTVVLTFSAETIEEHKDLADIAREYISRYYPIFRQDHVEIQIVQKEED
jgi:hypothetical protein